MKLSYLIFVILLISINCLAQDIPAENDPILNPYQINLKQVPEINGKSISFYLNHPSIDKYAKLFYNGKFAIGDDDPTVAMCDSLFTSNNQTRPFYLYLFCRIVELSDGAVAEITSGYCLNYLKKHPCEFMRFTKAKEYDFPQDQWISFVGWALYTESEFREFERQVDPLVRKYCASSDDDWLAIKTRIKAKLAK